MKPFWLLLSLLLVMGCAVGPQPTLNASHKSSQEIQTDLVECQTHAAIQSQGAGGIFSDPALRHGFREEAKRRYLAQCLQSRGWRWTTP